MTKPNNKIELCPFCGGKIVSQEIPDSTQWRKRRTKYQLLCCKCGENIRIEVIKKPKLGKRFI